MKNILNLDKTVILLCTLCCLSLRAEAEVMVRIQMAVEPEEITIGDVFTLSIEVFTEPGVELQDFDPAQQLSAFEIKDFSTQGPKRKSGKDYRHYTYQLSTFLSGTYTIEPFVVSYTTPQGTTDTIESSPLTVTVKPVTPKEGEGDDIRDIKKIQRLPVNPWVITGIILFIGLCVAGWALYYIRKKRLAQSLVKAYEQTLPAHTIALNRLQELIGLNLVQEGKIKEFYILLSEVIRQYLARRYGMQVMDKTTMELYKDLRESYETKKVSTQIKNFLDQCDLVKFARYVPDQNTIDQDIHNARVLIEHTKEPSHDMSGAAA
ncbi:MAG: hypothetical protein GF384_01075 [Elusimicrobia bacterium]|nr:hypothetical protein [Elusimicrobiota bacterium]